MSRAYRKPGDQVVWRSRPGGAVGYTMPCILVEDTPEFTVLLQPTGTVCKRRTGRRGGPRGRCMLPDGWDGGHEDAVWTGPSKLRFYAWGSAHAVLRSWDPEADRAEGWYIDDVQVTNVCESSEGGLRASEVLGFQVVLPRGAAGANPPARHLERRLEQQACVGLWDVAAGGRDPAFLVAESSGPHRGQHRMDVPIAQDAPAFAQCGPDDLVNVLEPVADHEAQPRAR